MSPLLESFLNLVRRFPATEFYSDLPFWGYFAVVAVLTRAVPVRWADVLLLAANALMLLALPRFNGAALLLYFGLAFLTFGVGAALNTEGRVPQPRARLLLAGVGIVAVLAVLAVFKYHLLQAIVLRGRTWFGEGASGFVFLIGISYSSFKAMHFIVEGYQRKLKQLRLLDYLNYLLFFPSFVSGPINRYQDFHENSAQARGSDWRDDLLPGLERIIHGLFKKFVITVILFPHTLIHMGRPVSELAGWQIMLGLYAYALYFYFDFSGYTDIAIGSARLLGFNLPENFNLPFLKKNIQQLWANWHISLTSWLTDYVYWPLVRKMRGHEWLRKHPLLASNIAIIVTFFLCGAWHGESVNFVLWGLYHGLGIAVVNVYQKWKRQARQPLMVKYFPSSVSYCVGVLLTFNFFALGLLFLLDAKQVATVLHRLL